MQRNLSSASAPPYIPSRSSSKIQAVGIVIPAHNHADTIAKSIANIFAANSYSGWRHSLWIVVVADACTDDTAKTAGEALGAFGQVLEISTSCSQTAHRIGASAVVEYFRDAPRHTLLLTSTDATAEVPRAWIDTQPQFSQSPIGLASNY